MARLGFKNLLKKKPREKEPEESSAGELGKREDASISYVQSPSALEYPEMRKKHAEAEKKTMQEQAQQPETQKQKEPSSLPRCPDCGWAIGYEENVCSNCGRQLHFDQ